MKYLLLESAENTVLLPLPAGTKCVVMDDKYSIVLPALWLDYPAAEKRENKEDVQNFYQSYDYIVKGCGGDIIGFFDLSGGGEDTQVRVIDSYICQLPAPKGDGLVKALVDQTTV